jgi:Calcineurin-like phosphoesterase superfamily domain
MIRILALSDIHNNVDCVRLLRGQESNDYDVVLVAGDMGSESAREILQICSTFRCPVLYIYGNWDNELDYNASFFDNCTHLHRKIVSIDGHSFAGFSGCSAHWGRNPLAFEVYAAVDAKYAELVCKLAALKVENKERSAIAKSEYDQSLVDLRRSKAAQGWIVTKKELAKLQSNRTSHTRTSSRDLYKLLTSTPYKRYRKERSVASRLIAAQNRSDLITLVTKSNARRDKLVLMTHDRTYRIHEGVDELVLHCFGHRHGLSPACTL